MIDPMSGLVIPKTIQGNLAWRKGLIQAAKQSAAIRRQLRAACSASPIYWLNAFGWTYLQKKVDMDGSEVAVHSDASNVPFITWRVQDDALQQLVDCIFKGKDGLVSKSRDMGASWICVAAFQWAFQFRSNVTFLELSRKESLVDRPGDMDSLFEKHRYLMRMQPDWLRPESLKDNRLHLENLKTGSTLIGESTNKDAGQASRKTAILLDEFARVEKGEEIDLATADTTACRIFNSTPGGPNTHFTRLWRQIQRGARDAALIELPWWRHPDKGAGAVQEDHPDKPGTKRWTSPWYKVQCGRRSKKNIAQNLDMDPGNSGDMFFDEGEINKHRAKHEREPREVGFVVYDEETTEERVKATVRTMNAADMRWVPNGARRSFRLWMPLIEQEVKCKVTGAKLKMARPRQDTRYCVGVDISTGAGASNSVATWVDHDTNMIVAKLWDSHTDPEKFAEQVALACVWFGGIRPPVICFEKNGPGGRFGRKLLALNYPAIYNQRTDSIKGEPETARWGWQSSPARKELLLGQYRDALSTDRIINPCKEALMEAADYVYDERGRIEPGLKISDDEGGGTALHGDHVISDALAEEARKNLPKEVVLPASAAPQGTFGWRREQRRRNRPEKAAWSD